MAELSGLVGILDEEGNFVEVRDLGPRPISVKPGRVLPFVEIMPQLEADQRYGEPSVEITEQQIVKTWPIEQMGPEHFDLTARQLRLGLIRNGISLDAVTAMIAAIEDPMIRDEALVYWEYSTSISWDHPMTQTLMGMLGIPQANMAYMWMIAKGYELQINTW